MHILLLLKHYRAYLKRAQVNGRCLMGGGGLTGTGGRGVKFN